MRGLEWHGDIPQRAWTGRSPQDWRANAKDNPTRLLQLIQEDISALRKATKRRKLKECRLLMSHATRIREFNRSIGKLMFSIQSIQGTVNRRAGVSLSLEVLVEQEAWAADQPLPTCSEIQEAINRVMSAPRTTPDEWKQVNGIHDGTLRWEDIQDYARFRQVFGNWKLPGDTLVRQDEILLRIHHALVDVPNRSKVVTALEDTLLGEAPSFTEYLQAVRSRSSKS